MVQGSIAQSWVLLSWSSFIHCFDSRLWVCRAGSFLRYQSAVRPWLHILESVVWKNFIWCMDLKRACLKILMNRYTSASNVTNIKLMCTLKWMWNRNWWLKANSAGSYNALMLLASVLWHCCLSGRKNIQPVKSWVMRCWHGYLSGAKCKWFAYGAADSFATHHLLLL